MKRGERGAAKAGARGDGKTERAESLASPHAFHAPTEQWFRETFGEPTEAQRKKAWPSILAHESTLLVAPTGSGKTLAAFLCAIDRLLFSPEPAKGASAAGCLCLAAQGARADIERNLRAPLAGIARAGGAPRHSRSPARASRSAPATRPPRARPLSARDPPTFSSPRPSRSTSCSTSQAREMLRSVETVIVDEIHALAPTKRGAHLFLSLERWRRCVGPARAAAAHRASRDAAAARRGRAAARRIRAPVGARRRAQVVIVDAGTQPPIELTSKCPSRTWARSADRARRRAPPKPARRTPPRSIWPSIHPRLVELIRAHRSTMIFANSRRLAERLAAAHQRDRGRGDGARPPRIGGARAARRRSRMRSRAAQLRVHRGHQLARARARHRRRRSGRADRGAALGRRAAFSASAAPVTRSAATRAA